MSRSLLTVALRFEQDVVAARQRARQIAALVGFDAQDQTRLATAVSEIARNAFRYAQGGKVSFSLAGDSAPQVLIVGIADQGPGIVDLERIMSGEYRSKTGMGIGILGVHRLMDQVDIRTASAAGTEILLKKLLPARAPLVTSARLSAITQELGRRTPTNPLEEIQQQNHELMQALTELRQRQDDLLQLNRELEDTNRGVVALYAELDEKADHLRRADEMKSRFLSNMSHEFRTPLNSIRALSRLLLDRVDGELAAEQEKQVRFISKSAGDLTALVDDLLDLAKIEAGKIDVRPVEFSVANLFSALRGMLRPLLVGDAVQLVFDEPETDLTLHTDEGKVSQILRNFISNAIKFTECGEVRVGATRNGATGTVSFSVTDTGIGIPEQDQTRVFEEFTQLAHPLQSRTKGTGLGLPLCRKLARLLGGEVSVRSEPGVGSTFTAAIPAIFDEPDSRASPSVATLDAGLITVLIVEDELETRFIHEKLLQGSRYQAMGARNLREAREMLARHRPGAILLDIMLRGEDTWRLLAELKGNPASASIPVLIVSTVEDERKGMALGADAYCRKPLSRAALLRELDRLVSRPVLVIDDDPAARYLMQRLLADDRTLVIEANDGQTGLLTARRARPAFIFLDMQLPDSSGEEILEALRVDSELHDVPVALVTSQRLSGAERSRLEQRAKAVIEKSELSADRARQLLAASGL